MKTKLSDNFQPNEGTYKWALIKYQYYDLPDMFLSDFKMHHAAKGERYTDWQRALKNFHFIFYLLLSIFRKMLWLDVIPTVFDS